jgi:hypothetical protein
VLVLSAPGEYADHTRQASEVGRTSLMPDAVMPTAIDLTFVIAWTPDKACLEAGDEYVALMLRCWAAAGLSDQQIVDRILDQLAITASVGAPPDRYGTALIVVARHCASVGMTLTNIIAILAHLAVEIPCWPSADEIAAVAQSAVAEFV